MSTENRREETQESTSTNRSDGISRRIWEPLEGHVYAGVVKFMNWYSDDYTYHHESGAEIQVDPWDPEDERDVGREEMAAKMIPVLFSLYPPVLAAIVTAEYGPASVAFWLGFVALLVSGAGAALLAKGLQIPTLAPFGGED